MRLLVNSEYLLKDFEDLLDFVIRRVKASVITINIHRFALFNQIFCFSRNTLTEIDRFQTWTEQT